MKNFTFTKSFSELLTEEGVQCSCGLQHGPPGDHARKCAVLSFYESWVQTGRRRWDEVKAASSTQGPPPPSP